MAGRFSVEAVFKAIDRVTAPVSRMQNRVGKFTRSMNRGFHKLNKSVRKFTSGMKKVGVATVAALALSGAALADVVSTGADFEQAITNVGAVSLQTRAQIKPLEDMAIKLGRTTKFTATQSANAMEIMSRAGFKTNEILAATPAVLAAAAASGLEIAEVANVVSNALKGMGLEASEAGKVADILALASSRTNSSIGSLGESLKNVASTARQLNVPIEETVAAIALLQDVGLDASVAGSAFNVMLTKMAAPSAAMTKKMRRLGISFKDSKGDMLPLQKVLEQLNTASKKVGGNFDKVAFLAELVGLRGQKAAANLGELFEKGKLDVLTKELENATGSAKKMAAIRMSTFEGSVLLLGSAVDAVKVKIFNLQDGALKGIIDRMTEWVGANEDLIATNIAGFITNLIDNFSSFIEKGKQIAGIAAGFIALVVVFKLVAFAATAVNLVMGAFILTMTLLKGSIMAFTFVVMALPKILGLAKAAMLLLNLAFAANPVGLVVAAIAALIAVAAFVILAWEPVSDFFSDLWIKITDVAKLASSAFKEVAGVFGFNLGEDDKKPKNGAPSTLAKIGSFLGFGDDEEETKKSINRPQIVSPQERVARSIDEQRTTSSAEVTIKDETGRAEVTNGKLGAGLSLQQSGAFQ